MQRAKQQQRKAAAPAKQQKQTNSKSKLQTQQKRRKTTKTTAKRSFSQLQQQQEQAAPTKFTPDFGPLLARTSKYPHAIVNTLPNGLKIASQQANSELATVSVAVEAGSRFENDQNNGSAHFLEHCFFKGTKNRSRTQLESLVENIGGSLNAFTTREQVVFTITTQRAHLPVGVELLSDMIQNSTISESAIESERHTILEEYNSVQEDLQETTYDSLHASVFKGTSLAYTILGPTSNIRKISKNDVETFRRVHYTTPNVVIAGTGDFSNEEFSELVKKNFSSLPTQPPEGLSRNRGKTPTWHSTMANIDRGEEFEGYETAMALAFPTPGANHPDHFALMTVQMMLNNLDPEMGTGSVAPFNTQYSDASLFGLYLLSQPGEMQQYSKRAVQQLAIQLKEASQHIIPARDQLKAALFAQYEGSETINQELCRHILSHSRPLHPTEIHHRVENVDQAAVDRVINEWFNFDKLSGVVLGPSEDVPELEELKKAAQLF